MIAAVVFYAMTAASALALVLIAFKLLTNSN